MRANDAAQQFLSDQDQMTALTGRIFVGHLRSIIGSMTVEQIVRERQTLATEVLDGSKQEMAKIGLAVDSMQIQSIDDMAQQESARCQAEYARQTSVVQADYVPKVVGPAAHDLASRGRARTSSDSPEDALLVQFQGMIAEYERAQIIERTRRGKTPTGPTGDGERAVRGAVRLPIRAQERARRRPL